jgi:RHS repeat-associated protein
LLLYQHVVGYDGAGNVQSVADSQVGTWSYTPDALNRLVTATSSAGTYAGLTLTEAYDAFGNRKSQTASGTYGGTVPQPTPVTFSGNNNRVDQWTYDPAGEVINDGTNMYEYGAEGHQTGTLNSLTGLTGYVYDAEGRRVEKIVVNGFAGPNPTTTVENEYLLGLNGEQVSVLDGSGNWKWTNVYAGGKQLATYDSAGTHFALTDWLGTKRVELNVTGASTVSSGEQCLSLPYGDGLDCTGTDVNQLHYTGKQHDTESNNDYFLARYYNNATGRFLSPAWAAKEQLDVIAAAPKKPG